MDYDSENIGETSNYVGRDTVFYKSAYEINREYIALKNKHRCEQCPYLGTNDCYGRFVLSECRTLLYK